MFSLRATLCQDVKDIMTQHLIELEPYMANQFQNAEEAPEQIINCLACLCEICQYTYTETTYEQYIEVCNCRDTIQEFLDHMNQPTNSDFKETTIGQIWIQANDWHKAASTHFQLSIEDVWNIIAPVTPDRLIDIGGGEYEARWWKPVPMMDIEILNHTEGVLLYGEPFEPHNLQGGLACRFSLSLTLCNEE